MSLKDDATTEITPRAKHIAIGSIGGIGKTTMGALATKDLNGIMLLTSEDGLSPLEIDGVTNIKIGCEINPNAENYLDLLATAYEDYQIRLKQIMVEEHGYKILVQDPLTTILGNPLEGYVVKNFYGGDYGKANAYGSKYQNFRTEMNKLIEAYKIINQKGITILSFCHCMVTDYKDPANESYKRWELALPIGNKVDLAAMLYNHVDGLFFGMRDVNVDEGKASGGTKHILRTSPEAGYVAKSLRAPQGKQLPKTILFDWNTLKTELTKLRN
jgi:hypothetical protein